MGIATATDATNHHVRGGVGLKSGLGDRRIGPSKKLAHLSGTPG